MLLALKVDVDTYRGTREGVPRLVEVLKARQAGATFLFSLGPDHTGRAIRRALRPGFMRKVRRTSVLSHYGLKTLLYGTLLPGPNIARRCCELMRMVAAEGFETGIHCHDHIRWQDQVAGADANWTLDELLRAVEAYRRVFDTPPHTHGAAGWQINVHALRLEQRLQFDYASDTRGSEPFLPVWNAELFDCPQLPTTLPTLDELIGLDGITPDTVAEVLLERTRTAPAQGHVYTLHAELEGMKCLPAFERLLDGWQEQGYRLVALRDLAATLDRANLPRHEIEPGSVPGRSGTLALQGRKFPD